MSVFPQRGVFVTGTDTGVGKTRIAASLVAGWRETGVDAVPMKPVQTGCRFTRGRLVSPDLAVSLKAAGLAPGSDEIADMAPFCYRPACSPHLAAKQAGNPVRIPAIAKAFDRLRRRHAGVVVEGAGGIAVPLNGRQTMLDLMVRLQLPVLLVARPGLGTINHTLLSLEALRRARLHILGVVVNQPEPGKWGMIERDNLDVISKRGKVAILACVRYGHVPDGLALARAIGAC